jgi:hypothetical protein
MPWRTTSGKATRAGCPLFRAAVGLQAIVVLLACDGSERPPSPGVDPKPPSGAAPAPVWVVDAREPGPSLPPVGRSLFDFLLASGPGVQSVPFPFEALVALVEERLGPGRSSSLKRVLVPRGRSLQRDAAPEAFFRFPRAILAVDGEADTSSPGPHLRLKDRLYVGYQETAGVLEVISYNEAAGRFEFQVVKDYRDGGSPRLVYANRALCMSCHQNGAPVFGRPLWDETNANPRIAALLRAERGDHYGYPSEPGVDVAYELDAATDRANLFSAWQVLWREGCGDGSEGASCRARLLSAALQYRLSGGGTVAGEATKALTPLLTARWHSRWPAGLAVPTSDIPNRDPLATSLPSGAREAGSLSSKTRIVAPATAGPELIALVRRQDVPPDLEPLHPRDPLATWRLDAGAEDVERLVRGLAEFLAEDDLRRFDDALSREDGDGLSRERFEVPCGVRLSPLASGGQRVVFSCKEPADSAAVPPATRVSLEGRLYVEGEQVVKGLVERIAFDGIAETPVLAARGGRLRRQHGRWLASPDLEQPSPGRRPRRANGDRITGFELSWPETASGQTEGERAGRLSLETVRDFARLESALASLDRRTAAGDTDVLGDQPFRRASLMDALDAELGLARVPRCCEDATPLSDAHTDPAAGPARDDDGQGRFVLLHRYCGECHGGPDRLPPNFLHGSPKEVEREVTQCAERMAFRLAMWQRGGRRSKTPMPPVSALRGLGVKADEWRSHEDLESLRDLVSGLLGGEAGTSVALDELRARPYEGLRPCLH